jgi:hypothetical protein
MMKTRKQAGATRGQAKAVAGRRPWSAPRARRLAASEAEFGAGATIDAEGFS